MNRNDSMNFRFKINSLVQQRESLLQNAITRVLISVTQTGVVRKVESAIPSQITKKVLSSQSPLNTFGVKTRSCLNAMQTRSVKAYQLAKEAHPFLQQCYKYTMKSLSSGGNTAISAQNGRITSRKVKVQQRLAAKAAQSKSFASLFKHVTDIPSLQYYFMKAPKLPRFSKKAAFLVAGTCYASAVLLGACSRPALDWIPDRSVLTESKYYVTSSELKAKANLLAASTSDYVRSFRSSKEQNTAETTSSKATKLVVSIFDSEPVQKEWLGWLGRAFSNKQTTDALLFVLLNGIKDQRFLGEVIDYGKDLIGNAVQQPEVKSASGQMVVDVLVKEKKVVQQTLELCKWFVVQPEVQTVANDFMKVVCLRGDVFDTVCWQLICGCQDACFETTEVQDAASATCLAAAKSQRVKNAAQDAYVDLPKNNLVDMLTFGYGDSIHQTLQENEDFYNELDQVDESTDQEDN